LPPLNLTREEAEEGLHRLHTAVERVVLEASHA